MVSWADVKRWDPAALGRAIDALKRDGDRLVGVNDELGATATPASWHGPAAEAAQENLQWCTRDLRELAAGVAAVRRAGHETEIALEATKRAITEAEDLAAHHEFTITETGQIQSTAPDDRELADDEVRTRRQVQAELVDQVEQILRRADDIDHDLAAILAKAANNEIDDGSGTTLAAAADAGTSQGGVSIVPPPPGASPSDNAAWWNTLSDVAKQWIINNQPELIGNLNGIPAAARSAANLERVNLERTRLLDQLHALEAENRALAGPFVAFTELENTERIHEIEAKLASLDAIDRMTITPQGEPLPDRQLLSLDLSGERAGAAIASGDVDTADHVAVFTPGMDSTVTGMNTSLKEMQEVRDEAGLMVNDARGGSVAVVTWLDYEPPNATWYDEAAEGASPGRAEDGASRLAPFLDGIEAARGADQPAHITALGHSYGSLTTGLALHETTAADDAVFLGSPGTGDVDLVETPDGFELQTSTEQMNVPDGHLYNLETDGDLIADLGWHGGDPSWDSNLQQLSTHDATAPDGSPLIGSEGHGGYTVADGTLFTSEHNTAAVIAGREDLLIRK